MEVEGEKAEDGHLGDDVQAADRAQAPETPVADRPLDVLELEWSMRGLAEERGAARRAEEAENAEERVRVRDGEVRQEERADESPERDGGLADPQREAAL